MATSGQVQSLSRSPGWDPLWYQLACQACPARLILSTCCILINHCGPLALKAPDAIHHRSALHLSTSLQNLACSRFLGSTRQPQYWCHLGLVGAAGTAHSNCQVSPHGTYYSPCSQRGIFWRFSGQWVEIWRHFATPDVCFESILRRRGLSYRPSLFLSSVKCWINLCARCTSTRWARADIVAGEARSRHPWVSCRRSLWSVGSWGSKPSCSSSAWTWWGLRWWNDCRRSRARRAANADQEATVSAHPEVSSPRVLVGELERSLRRSLDAHLSPSPASSVQSRPICSFACQSRKSFWLYRYCFCSCWAEEGPWSSLGQKSYLPGLFASIFAHSA